MTRLLNCLLVGCRRFTILEISLNLRITLSLHAQLSLQYEHRREMHHTIRSRWRITEEEFPRTLLQLRFQKVHIVPNIPSHALFCLFYVASDLFPASIQDCYTVKGPSRLRGMYPLKLLIPLWVAQRSEQLMVFVVLVAEISDQNSDIRRDRNGLTYSEIVPLSPILKSPSSRVGNLPSPPASFLNAGGANPFSRGANLTS